MKARVTFYFAAVVALVLFLACVQSHATERRDPLIIQDTPTTQAARSTSMVLATALPTKPAQKNPQKTKMAAGKSHDGMRPSGDAKAKPSANTGETQSGSSNSGGSR